MSPERFARIKDTLNKRQLDLTVVMEQVHKSHNFAAIVRSCEAVGVATAHASTPEGELAKHIHTAAGSSKWVDVHVHEHINTPLNTLREQGYQLLAAHLDDNAVDFRTIDYTQPTAIVMGSELHGISDPTAQAVDQSIIIPMMGLTESLNVSVATALILFEAQRQRQNAGRYDKSQWPEADYKKKLFEWCYPDIAQHCQARNLPYPELDDEGYLPPKALG